MHKAQTILVCAASFVVGCLCALPFLFYEVGSFAWNNSLLAFNELPIYVCLMLLISTTLTLGSALLLTFTLSFNQHN